MGSLPTGYDIDHIPYEGYYIVDTRNINTKVSMNWHNIVIDNDKICGKIGTKKYELVKYRFEGQIYFIPKSTESEDHIPHLNSSAGITDEKYRVLEATADYHNKNIPERSKKTSKSTPKQILENKLNSEERSNDFKIE